MQRVPNPSVPRVAPSVPPSVRESVCQMFYSTQLRVFLAPGCFIRKGGGGWVCCGSPEWGHDCFMFPNLPDHCRLTSNIQNTCFQTAFLIQPRLRWKEQKVLDPGEIVPGSKTWHCLNGGAEWFSIDEWFGACVWSLFPSNAWSL